MEFAFLANLLLFLGMFGATFVANVAPEEDPSDPLYREDDYTDEIDGTDGADTVTADRDNLAFFLRGGDDTLTGSAGADYANLGGGQDRASLGAGNDIALGGDGDDWLDLGQGNDQGLGGAGLDTLFGQSGNDILRGEAGNDSLIGGAGADTLQGGDGNDFLSGFDSLAAGAAGLSGAEGNDLLLGGNGNDVILLGHGDEASGGAGNDQFILDHRWSDTAGLFHLTDFVRGQDALHIVYTPVYSAETSNEIPPTIRIETTAEGATLVRLNGTLIAQLDGVTGLLASDIHLTPDAEVDATYAAGRFSETIGTDGADSYAGSGTGPNSWLTGGGDDVISSGTSGADYARMGAGNDSAALGDGNDLLRGEDGSDTLDGQAGNDVMSGGEGNDQMLGGAGGDKLFGDRGDDGMFGGDGIDQLSGGAGNDTLSGYASGAAGEASQTSIDGADSLSGGDGNDRLILGRGDTGIGGSGADSFVLDNRWAVGSQVMTISDWVRGEDSLTLQYTPRFTSGGAEILPVMTIAAGPANAYAIIRIDGVDVANVTGAATTLTLADVTLQRIG